MKLFSSTPKSHEDILDTHLYKLPNTNDYITYADAVEGTLITGATGSGKTSGVGKHIAKGMLTNNFSLCIFCSKKNERANWLKLIEQHAPQRMKDVVVFNKASNLRFNFLEYEMSRAGEGSGEIINAVDALMNINELNRIYLSGDGNGKEERFWDLSLKRLISRSIVTLQKAGEEISIPNMQTLVTDSLKGNEASEYLSLESQANDDKLDPVKRQKAREKLYQWIESNYLLKVLLSITASNEEEQEEILFLMKYWLKQFPKIGERATNIIVESFMGIVEPFLNKGVLKSHFSSGLSDALRPENIYQKNTILIIDFPVKEFKVAALYAASIYKTTFQTAMERRDVELEKNPKPVGFFIDEYQQFCSYKTDLQFQATARSSWIATVYITQNIDGIASVMGSNQPDSKAKSLLGNLNLKFFASNGNYNTNMWASNMIGKHFVDYENITINEDKRISKSKNQHKDYRISPEFFTTLKTGRKRNKYMVETVVFKAGRTWGRDKQNHAVIGFDQRR